MSQQSQLDFLESVVGWDVDKCRQNVDSVLPEMIMKFKESTFIEEGIGFLQVVCNNFLPVVPLEEADDKIFSHIGDATSSLVKDALNKIHLNVEGALRDTAEELKEVVVECLQWLGCITDCVETCVRQMLQLASVVPLPCIQSLPTCAISVLTQTYTHCKESSTLYGHLLDDLGEPLSALFKKAHSLQLVFLSLLDKMSVPSTGLEEHVKVLCSVCNGLFEMCKVVTSLDVKLVVGIWKGISRLCSQNLTLLKDRLDVCPLICYLCDEVTSGYSYLFQLCPSADSESLSQGDDKAFTKCVKVQGFQMKVLVALLRDFVDFLGPCEQRVLTLLLYLLRRLPPCLNAASLSSGQESEIRGQVANAVVPALQYLVANRAFRIYLTGGQEDLDPEDSLPLLLLQLNVLDLIPKCKGDMVDCWFSPANHGGDSPSKNLLAAIFQTVQKCYIEMRVPVMLPGPMVEGKPQSQVSLYQHVVVHLCGFIGACSARHFPILESTLMEVVFGPDGLSSLLATDCWCFLARYGSATLCYDHVQLLLKTLLQATSKRSVTCLYTGRWDEGQARLARLLQRLVKFLSPEHQASLVDLYTPEQNLDLWLTLTLVPFCEKVQVRVGKTLAAWCVRVLEAHCGKAGLVLKALSCLSQLLAVPSLASSCFDQAQRAILLDTVCQLWANQLTAPSQFGPVREELLVILLPVTKHFLPLMETTHILQVIQALHASVSQDSSCVPLLLACADFMSGLGSRQFQAPTERGQLLSTLPQVFHRLLTNGHPLVQTRALSSFSQFASLTPHEECIPVCLREDSALQMRVDNYLHQIPYSVSDEPFMIADYLKQRQRDGDNAGCLGKHDRNSAVCQEQRRVDDVEKKKNAMHDGDPTIKNSEEATNNERIEIEDHPPSKKAKLDQLGSLGAPSHDVMITKSTVAPPPPPSSSSLPSSSPPSFNNVLEKLKAVADDLETLCTGASPPSEFVTQSQLVLSRISDCVTGPSSCWFDSLS